MQYSMQLDNTGAAGPFDYDYDYYPSTLKIIERLKVISNCQTGTFPEHGTLQYPKKALGTGSTWEGLQQLRLQLGGSDLISSDCKVIMCQLPLVPERMLEIFLFLLMFFFLVFMGDDILK